MHRGCPRPHRPHPCRSFRPTVFVEVAPDRSRRDAMGPDRGPALLVQTRCESVEIAGAEAIVPDILLPCPNDLQRVGTCLAKRTACSILSAWSRLPNPLPMT